MSDRYTDRLSEYLDRELAADERLEMEAHLRECAECAATLAGLERVVTRAGALSATDTDPVPDLWPAIESRISRPRMIPIGSAAARAAAPERRRLSFSIPQLAAACLVCAVLSGAMVWYLRNAAPRPGPSGLQTGELIPGSPRTAMAEPSAVTHPAASSAAVEELRRTLANRREDLDPATVRTLEESLMVIEIAIREGQRALDADPHNPYVRAHLDETKRRKVELLHQATMLASATR